MEQFSGTEGRTTSNIDMNGRPRTGKVNSQRQVGMHQR